MDEIKVISKSTLLSKEIDVYGTVSEPLFKAKDVAEWLELTNVSDMVSRIDKEEVTKLNLGSLEGETWFLTEDGLYEVLMQSRKPIAKQFKKGVKEILKNIRRTGSYKVTSPIEDKMAAATWAAGFLNMNETSRLMLAKSILDPLGLPTPDYVQSHGVTHSASELLKSHGSSMSIVKFNARLVELGILRDASRQGSTKVHHFKVITDRGLEYGENQVSPKNPQQTQPRWYDTQFSRLLQMVQ